MTTTTTRVKTGKTRPRHGGNTLLWAAQIALAALFMVAAVPKLAGAHPAVAMFTRVGAGQWLRYLVGIAELAGAVGLLIPGLAGLAAAGLAADMAGATIINITVLHSAAAILTIPLCVALLLLAWNRREQTSPGRSPQAITATPDSRQRHRGETDAPAHRLRDSGAGPDQPPPSR